MKLSAIASTLCLCLYQAAMGATHDAHQHPEMGSLKVPPAAHGMVIFGKETIYASHIPMFMIPHDWQAQFEVKLEHKTLDANAFFKQVNSDQPLQKLFTFSPKPFVLPDLLSGKILTFSGDLYEGNFESGGTVILKDVTVRVVKAMNIENLKKTSAVSPLIKYLVVGDGPSSYLAHKIVAPASFDQLIEVKWLRSLPLTNAEISLDRADSLENRLKVGSFYKLIAEKLMPVTTMEDADVQILGEFSCLLGPDFYLPCE